MAENVITNANDVELFLERGSTQRGTPQEMGRIVVDEFAITKEEDDSLISGVGFRLPAGVTNGDVTFSFSFTIQGEDVSTFEMIANADGTSNVFSMTAQRPDADGNIQWEYSLGTCKATSEEVSASSGDVMEYAVDGIAVTMDKTGVTEDGSNAWS